MHRENFGLTVVLAHAVCGALGADHHTYLNAPRKEPPHQLLELARVVLVVGCAITAVARVDHLVEGYRAAGAGRNLG